MVSRCDSGIRKCFAVISRSCRQWRCRCRRSAKSVRMTRKPPDRGNAARLDAGLQRSVVWGNERGNLRVSDNRPGRPGKARQPAKLLPSGAVAHHLCKRMARGGSDRGHATSWRNRRENRWVVQPVKPVCREAPGRRQDDATSQGKEGQGEPKGVRLRTQSDL